MEPATAGPRGHEVRAQSQELGCATLNVIQLVHWLLQVLEKPIRGPGVDVHAGCLQTGAAQLVFDKATSTRFALAGRQNASLTTCYRGPVSSRSPPLSQTTLAGTSTARSSIFSTRDSQWLMRRKAAFPCVPVVFSPAAEVRSARGGPTSSP